MSSNDLQVSGPLSPRTTRRSLLKAIAGGTATAALLATARITDAGRPLPNREHGSAPVIGGTSSFRGPASSPGRYERRSPE